MNIMRMLKMVGRETEREYYFWEYGGHKVWVWHIFKAADCTSKLEVSWGCKEI